MLIVFTLRCAVVAMLIVATIDSAVAKVSIWSFEIDESQVKNGSELDGSTNSPATGFGYVEYDTDTNIISYEITWDNLFGELTKLHIHGPASPTSSNPSHLIEIFGPPDIPASVNLHSDTWTDSHQLVALQQVGINPATGQPYDPIAPAEIIAIMESGQSYINVHSNVFGVGEIRGNLGVPIPEPASIGLSAVGGLLAVGGMRLSSARSRLKTQKSIR